MSHYFRPTPIGRATPGEFKILIKRRNTLIPYFEWRRELALAIMDIYSSVQFQFIIAHAVVQVAVKKGNMRELWRLFLINQFILASRRFTPFHIVVPLNDAVVTTYSGGKASYLKHHVYGHKDFNIYYGKEYKNPTTPNTKPIDRLELMQNLPPRILQEYSREFRHRGLVK